MQRIYLVLSMLLVLTSQVFAQSTFEGMIELTTTVPMLGDKEIPVTVSVKGERLKLVTDIIGMGEMSMVIDKPAHKIVAILSGMNMAYEMDMNELAKANADSLAPEAAPTGKKETIHEYACVGYSCPLKNGVEMELLMTKDMPNTMHSAVLNSFSGALQAMRIGTGSFEKLMNDGYAPVRSIIKKNGAEQAILTLNKFEKKTIDDTVFDIPKNLKIQKLDPATMTGKAAGSDGQ